MKYIKEYINFEEWDNEEIDEEEYNKLVNVIIDILLNDFYDNYYESYDELLDKVDNTYKQNFIDKYTTDHKYLLTYDINTDIINITQNCIENYINMDMIKIFLMDIVKNYPKELCYFLPEEVVEKFKHLL